MVHTILTVASRFFGQKVQKCKKESVKRLVKIAYLQFLPKTLRGITFNLFNGSFVLKPFYTHWAG